MVAMAAVLLLLLLWAEAMAAPDEEADAQAMAAAMAEHNATMDDAEADAMLLVEAQAQGCCSHRTDHALVARWAGIRAYDFDAEFDRDSPSAAVTMVEAWVEDEVPTPVTCMYTNVRHVRDVARSRRVLARWESPWESRPSIPGGPPGSAGRS